MNTIVLTILSVFGLTLAERRTVEYRIEERGKHVIMYFSSKFPTLNTVDTFFFPFHFEELAHVGEATLVQNEAGTVISFICEGGRNDPRIKDIFKIIKKGVKPRLKFQEISLSQTKKKATNSFTPARAPARASFL